MAFLSTFVALLMTLGIKADILEGPTDVYASIGSNVTLVCKTDASDAPVWTDDATRDIIFQQQAKYSENTKYTNFLLDSENTYNMIITEVQLEDDGDYSCQIPDVRKSATVNVEVPPIVTIVSGAESFTLTLKEDSNINISCMASFAIPAVNVTWQINNRDTNFDFHSYVMIVNETTGESNTSSTLFYTASKGDTKISCQTFGQRATKSVKQDLSLNILYLPQCSISNISRGSVTIVSCDCRANPPATISISSNGILHPNSVISIPNNQTVNISCNASNHLGSDYSTLMIYPSDVARPTTSPGSPTVIIIIIIIVIIIIVIVVSAIALFIYRNKPSKAEEVAMSKTEKENEEDPEAASKKLLTIAQNIPLPDSDDEDS